MAPAIVPSIERMVTFRCRSGAQAYAIATYRKSTSRRNQARHPATCNFVDATTNGKYISYAILPNLKAYQQTAKRVGIPKIKTIGQHT